MLKIIKTNLCYFLIRQYMLFGFKRFYSQVTVVGKENLPSDECAIIFAPNHLNALMDALAVLLAVPKNKPVLFVAKADLFQSKTILSALQFAKIVPAYRKTDGFENISKNNNTFELCIDALSNKEAVAIMPEGGQGEKHFIRPIVKGIFRIAFEAQKKFGNNKEVKIVPIGIDMGDLVKSGSHLIINIGKPIEINEYIGEYNENPASAINKTKRILHQSLSDLTLDIASEKYYDTIKLVSDIEGNRLRIFENEENITFRQFTHKQKVIKSILRIQREDSSKMNSIDNNAALIKKRLEELNLTPAVFKESNKSVLELILTLPVFIFGFITNFFPVFVPVWIRKWIKVEYEGFYSSIQFGLGLITFPVFYVLQAFLFYKFIITNIIAASLFFVFEYFSRKYSIEWWKATKKRIKKSKNRKEILNINIIASEAT